MLVQAGWPGWILGAMSVLALAIVLERGWSLRRKRVLPDPALTEALRLLSTVRREDPQLAHAETGRAIRILECSSPAGGLLASMVRHHAAPREQQEGALGLAGRQAVRSLERNLPLLSTLGSLAPLVGLLGTVAGMIKAFGVQAAIESDPQALAAAIAMALHATALGLGVAIPAILAHRMLRERCDNLIGDLEGLGQHFLEISLATLPAHAAPGIAAAPTDNRPTRPAAVSASR